MGVEASYNFRRVSETVTTSGIVGAKDLASLSAEGYGLLVNLLPADSEYAVAGEASIVEEQGVDYVYIPVDFAAPTHEQFDDFVTAMDAHAGETIHVHCAANYRVSAFYGLYAVKAGIWSVEDADRHLDSLWEPDDVWREFIVSERARIQTPE
jgi:protein tyrosine phosphatase (PTP) superfamily phosphohydrolase (DUF442 family)